MIWQLKTRLQKLLFKMLVVNAALLLIVNIGRGLEREIRSRPPIFLLVVHVVIPFIPLISGGFTLVKTGLHELPRL